MGFLVFQANLPDRVERRCMTRADGVITVCDEQNDRLHARFNYPRDRMVVVHNTPDLATFAPVRMGSSTPPRVLAYHGQMTAQRGLDRLIRGFAQIAPAHPQARLELAGDGESRPALMRLAQECQVADRVRFVGKYRFDEVISLYSETDVGLVTYPIDESINHTIGNKLFDYFACGKPVVVSPAVPLRRVVEETGAGLVLRDCTPEAIAAGLNEVLSADPTAWAERGLAAARSKYNWANDTGVLLDLLRRFH
jgi:glycosyltransferase involved in cell wall biosynthesis